MTTEQAKKIAKDHRKEIMFTLVSAASIATVYFVAKKRGFNLAKAMCTPKLGAVASVYAVPDLENNLVNLLTESTAENGRNLTRTVVFTHEEAKDLAVNIYESAKRIKAGLTPASELVKELEVLTA